VLLSDSEATLDDVVYLGVNQMWLSSRHCTAKRAENSHQCWIKAWNVDHYLKRVMRTPGVSKRRSTLLKKWKPRIIDIMIGSS